MAAAACAWRRSWLALAKRDDAVEPAVSTAGVGVGDAAPRADRAALEWEGKRTGGGGETEISAASATGATVANGSLAAPRVSAGGASDPSPTRGCCPSCQQTP